MLEVVGELSVDTLFERHTEESVCRSGLPKASERETFTHTHPFVTHIHEGISIHRERRDSMYDPSPGGNASGVLPLST